MDRLRRAHPDKNILDGVAAWMKNWGSDPLVGGAYVDYATGVWWSGKWKTFDTGWRHVGSVCWRGGLFKYGRSRDIKIFTFGSRLIQVLWFPEFTLPIEGTEIVEEDAALVSWYVDELNVFTYFLTDCGKIDDRL